MIARVDPNESLNVLGGPLQTCSTNPMTGFLRDGCCNTNDQDQGSHTVCVEMTAEFLEFSKLAGNDLSTPMPAYGFPGLNPGDKWCLCVTRWKQAFDAGVAAPIYLEASHSSALEWVDLDDLKEHAVDSD